MSFDTKALCEATMASVGIVQGLYQSFLKENDGDKDIALRLTQTTWYGLMKTVKTNNDDEKMPY